MKKEKLYRKYTVRLFPTPEQESNLFRHIGACRFVWNYMYFLQQARYENGRKHLTAFDMCKEITYMKKTGEFSWLKDIPIHSMQCVCKNLDHAYMMFFKNIHGHPLPKKKNKSKLSYPLDQSPAATYFKEIGIFVVPKVGHVKCKHNYKVPIGRMTSGHNPICDPQIQYVKHSKKWILTFSLEYETQVRELTNDVMGIDLGIKDLAVIAVGDKKVVFPNINKTKRIRALEKKKRYIKRTISRKYCKFNGFGNPSNGEKWEKSKSIEKYEQILREIEAKIVNIRENNIHQITRQLVNMLPKKVVMEDLDIKKMLKNKHMYSQISEQNWFKFIRNMRYKCEEYGIEFVQADRFFPSSKLCSCCGHKKKDLKLSDRIYVCPNCGLEIDRDYNAAINLMNYTENTTDKLVTKVERNHKKKKVTTMTNVSVA